MDMRCIFINQKSYKDYADNQYMERLGVPVNDITEYVGKPDDEVPFWVCFQRCEIDFYQLKNIEDTFEDKVREHKRCLLRCNSFSHQN